MKPHVVTREESEEMETNTFGAMLITSGYNGPFAEIYHLIFILPGLILSIALNLLVFHQWLAESLA